MNSADPTVDFDRFVGLDMTTLLYPEPYYVKQFSGPVKVKSFSLTHLDTKASGDVGYDVGTDTQTMSGGEHPMDAGKYVVILRRSGNEWKVAYAIYNSDRPPTPPAGGAPPN